MRGVCIPEFPKVVVGTGKNEVERRAAFGVNLKRGQQFCNVFDVVFMADAVQTTEDAGLDLEGFSLGGEQPFDGKNLVVAALLRYELIGLSQIIHIQQVATLPSACATSGCHGVWEA